MSIIDQLGYKSIFNRGLELIKLLGFRN